MAYFQVLLNNMLSIFEEITMSTKLSKRGQCLARLICLSNHLCRLKKSRSYLVTALDKIADEIAITLDEEDKIKAILKELGE